MDDNRKKQMEIRAKHAVEALHRNNMEACFVTNAAQAVKKVREYLHAGDIVAVGGSVTLQECGVTELLKSGAYQYLDREAPGLSMEDKQEIYLKAFAADAYLLSANAVTMNGELYNVDGTSNRVAALLYGPKSVIVVAGYNKLVEDVDEAVARVKRIAAPANCQRLHCETPCASIGACVSGRVGGGCSSEGRVCANFVVCGRQRIPGRIKVILVGEELGY